MNLVELREWTMWLAEWFIVYILIVEYYYDKKVYESKRKRIKRTKDKVKVEIDKLGQAIITEQPKGVDIEISHTGEDK